MSRTAVISRQMHDHVGVWWAGGTGVHHQHSPAHPQVHHEHATGVEIAQQVLPASTCRNQPSAREAVDDCFASLTSHRALAKHLHTFDDTAHSATLDTAPHRFDLG